MLQVLTLFRATACFLVLAHASGISWQAAWRARQARLLLRANRAARTVQSMWRSCMAQRLYQVKRMSAIVIQAHWRRLQSQCAYQTRLQAVLVVSNYVAC